MPNKIERLSITTGSYTLTTSTSSTARLPFVAHAGGVMIVTGVTSTPATLTWYVSTSNEGTLVPLQDGAGSAVTTTVASTNSYINAYPIPDAAFGAQFIAATTNAGTLTVQFSVKG